MHRGFFHAVGPGLNLRGRLLGAVGIQERGNGFVGGAGLEGLADVRVFDPLPVKEEVVERSIGVVVAYLAGDVGARLVGQARKNGVAAGAMTGAGGGLFGEVFSVNAHIVLGSVLLSLP